MSINKKNNKTVYVIYKTFFCIKILVITIITLLLCIACLIFAPIMSNDWMAKVVFPLLILFLALEVFSHLDTITITDRLIEIGETPVFEKSEIAKISIQKIEGYISKEGIKTLHSL